MCIKTLFKKAVLFVYKLLLPTRVQQQMSKEREFRKTIPSALDKFLPENERNNPKIRSQISKDMISCYRKYRSKASEYFLFGFRGMQAEKRDSFITDYIKDEVLIKTIGSDLFFRELKDKYNFFLLAGKYFKREAFFVKAGGGGDFQSFNSFVLKHHEIFVKSNSSSCGRGINCYMVTTEKESEEIFKSLINTGDSYIVEEKIQQVPEMSQWNESSVNTVRLPAILSNGKWSVLKPVLRMGREGSIVDNAGSGGVLACIDEKTGILYTDGIDEDGKYYIKHPDSGLVFKGWQVPRWKELLLYAEEIHRSMPKHKYVGWDFALTNRGWALIEGNWGQFLSQYNEKIGVKQRFFELLGVEDWK